MSEKIKTDIIVTSKQLQQNVPFF